MSKAERGKVTGRLIDELRMLPEGVLAALADGLKLSKDRNLSRLGWSFHYLAEDMAEGTAVDEIAHIELWADLWFWGHDKALLERLEEAGEPPWPAVLAAVKAVNSEVRLTPDTAATSKPLEGAR